MLGMNDYLDDVNFEDDFLESFRKKGYREGIEGLMLAVLKDAVDCYQNFATAQTRKGQRLFSEAEEWILDDGTDWPFSFVNVCETLDFDPRYLREGLIHWKTKILREDKRGADCQPIASKGVSEGDGCLA